MKLGAGLIILALFFAVGSAHGISLMRDPFLEQHAAATAQNIYDAFSIRFTSERRTFRAREPIEIELVYERGARFTAEPADGPDALSLTQAQFDRPVAAPLRVVDSKFDDHIPGGVPGCLTYAPIVVRRTLTNMYRFDTPGRYRMFFQSRQVTPEFETSNILEFEILPRDAAWERNVLKQAEGALNESPVDKHVAAHAFETLRALATNEATAILARYYQAGNDLETAGVGFGLFANPDRGFVVDVLSRELRKPERTFGWQFMPTLARLELARRHPDGPPYSHDEYLEVIRQFAISRARILNVVPGRLTREMRDELMDFPSDQEHFARGVVTPAARDFPQEAIAAFRALSPEAQRSRLLGSWRRFADPVFLPLLRSLYESPANGSNEVRDLALRRLFQLVPEEGRTAMLGELQRKRLRISMETLAMLPDETLPTYEARWAAFLEGARQERDLRSAAQRIERFATDRIATIVGRFYEREDGSLPCGTRAALLAYLIRADPQRGRDLLVKAATGFNWDETCSRSVLEDAADLEWTPEMEAAALAVLAHPDAGAAGTAAGPLSQYGSASARPALEQRLEALQGLIHQRSNSATESEKEMRELQTAEWLLTRALAGAVSWRLTPEERRHLAARCSDGGCSLVEYDSRFDPGVFLSAPRPRIGDERRLDFFVEDYSGHSLVDLDRKLRQFPPDTRIYWDDRPWNGRDSLNRWTWSERDQLFERVRGQAAGYGVILQRERIFRPDPGPLKFGPPVDLKSASAPSQVLRDGQGCR